MTVGPHAVAHLTPESALLRQHARQSRPQGAPNLPDRAPLRQVSQHTTDVPATRRPHPSGMRVDGYTLWAYGEVFKGMVLDIVL